MKRHIDFCDYFILSSVLFSGIRSEFQMIVAFGTNQQRVIGVQDVKFPRGYNYTANDIALVQV